jgi:hypothetical protein
MTRSIAALALVLVCTGARLGATAIVVARSADGTRVILAADSASTTYAPDGSVRYRPGRCKIQPAGKWWIVNGALDITKGLDVPQTMRQAAAPAVTMAAALTALERAYHATIRPAVLRLDHYFTTGYQTDKPVITVLVAGEDGGQLKVGLFGAFLKQQQPRELVAGSLVCPGALCDEPGPFVYGASLGDPIPRLILQRPRPAWLERADAAAARRLIRLQIARTPDRVSAPIDVLEVTAVRARWVDRDPRSACAEK